MGTGNPRLRARARTAGIVAAALAALPALVIVAAPVVIRGARFGWVVERMLPAMRGHVQVGGGRWTWGAVLQIVRGRAGFLQLDDVRVVDPEGTEVLRAGRIAASLQLRRESPRLVVRDLRIERARWVFADMRRGGGVGFLVALAPAAPARPGRGGGPS